MKDLLRIFYDILLKQKVKDLDKSLININIIKKYLEPQNVNSAELTDDLSRYFLKFYNFCFELSNDNMLRGVINFKY